MTESLFDLHKRYAPNNTILDLVWTHSLIVEQIAAQIIANHPELSLDQELVRQGALLHDIGVYLVAPCPCHPRGRETNKEPYIKHAIMGADVVRKEGLGELLALIVERHTGTGISQAQIVARQLPLPTKDFIPQTLEEKLVAYADNFHSKKPKFNTYADIVADLSKYGKDNVARLEEWKEMFGILEINQQLTTYNLQ